MAQVEPRRPARPARRRAPSACRAAAGWSRVTCSPRSRISSTAARPSRPAPSRIERQLPGADPGADRAEQLGIAAAHPLAPAQAPVEPGDQRTAPPSRSPRRSARSASGGPKPGPGGGEAERDQRQGQPVGQPLMLEVERGDQQQPPAEHSGDRGQRQRMGDAGATSPIIAAASSTARCRGSIRAPQRRQRPRSAAIGEDRHQIARARAACRRHRSASGRRRRFGPAASGSGRWRGSCR